MRFTASQSFVFARSSSKIERRFDAIEQAARNQLHGPAQQLLDRKFEQEGVHGRGEPANSDARR
jgi:hypothetical protein